MIEKLSKKATTDNFVEKINEIIEFINHNLEVETVVDLPKDETERCTQKFIKIMSQF